MDKQLLTIFINMVNTSRAPPQGGGGVAGRRGGGYDGGMKKFLIASSSFLTVALVGLWGFVLLAGRDAAPPDEMEFRSERPEVAPEENAFTYFLLATNSLVETTNVLLVADYLAGKVADDGALREWVEKNAECLALVKRGTECAACQMPVVESFETTMPYLASWLKIGRLLSVQSRQARLDGHRAEAAESALVAARLGILVLENAESTIGYLVGVSIANEALEQLLALAADPAATAEEWKALAEQLNALGPFDVGLARAMKAECRLAADLVDQFADGQIDWIDVIAFENAGRDYMSRLLAAILRSPYFFRPQATLRSIQEEYRRAIQDVSLPYAQLDGDIEPDFGRSWVQWIRPNAMGKFFRLMLVVPVNRTMEKKCRMESLLAGAKLVVACNRFEQARGRRPETLADLVPEFLSEVPRDPYDGAPFRYSAEKGLVWAVGKNLTDEGGSMRVPDADLEYEARRDRRRAEDFVFEIQPTAKAE